MLQRTYGAPKLSGIGWHVEATQKAVFVPTCQMGDLWFWGRRKRKLRPLPNPELHPGQSLLLSRDMGDGVQCPAPTSLFSEVGLIQSVEGTSGVAWMRGSRGL